MSNSRNVTGVILAAAVAVGSIVPLSTSALAGGYYRDHGYRHYDDGYRHYPKYHGYNGYGEHHYRKKRRNNAGKAIAIGAGLLMLGIIASEAHRNRHRH